MKTHWKNHRQHCPAPWTMAWVTTVFHPMTLQNPGPENITSRYPCHSPAKTKDSSHKTNGTYIIISKMWFLSIVIYSTTYTYLAHRYDYTMLSPSLSLWMIGLQDDSQKRYLENGGQGDMHNPHVQKHRHMMIIWYIMFGACLTTYTFISDYIYIYYIRCVGLYLLTVWLHLHLTLLHENKVSWYSLHKRW